ncbi:hypothetical protein D3C77_620210 [compost metagenome]
MAQLTIRATDCTCRPCFCRLISVTTRQPPRGSSSGAMPIAWLRSITDNGSPRRVATPSMCGCASGSRVSRGIGMISLTFSRLIAICLPLRSVKRRSDSESAV